METIKLYLENMFMNLPAGEKVDKAKRELLAMMEDKYNELKADGKTENEAVGIVISEFGNLDEIAEELGIKDTVTQANEMPQGRYVSLETAKEYMTTTAISARRIAIGVFLCVCSPIALIILGVISETNAVIPENMAGGIGLGILLILVAIAVPLFIYNGMALSKYEYLQKDSFQMDYSVKKYISELQEANKSSFALRMTVGTVICILGVIPLVMTAMIDENNDILAASAVGLLLFMVAIATLFFITGGLEEGAYNVLLQKGDYALEKKDNKVMQSVSSVYWMIVTAIYLAWSFITKDWEFTWIVWPVAGVLFGAIAAIISVTKKD